MKSRKSLFQGVQKLDLVKNRWISAAVLFHQVIASGWQLMLNFVQNFLFLCELKILKEREMTFVLGPSFSFVCKDFGDIEGSSIGLQSLTTHLASAVE